MTEGRKERKKRKGAMKERGKNKGQRGERREKKNRKVCSAKETVREEQGRNHIQAPLASLPRVSSTHFGHSFIPCWFRPCNMPSQGDFLPAHPLLGAGSPSDVVWVMSGTWLRSQGKGREFSCTLNESLLCGLRLARVLLYLLTSSNLGRCTSSQF